MKRKLFTLFAAMSLLLCAGVRALWMRSYCRVDVVSFRLDDNPRDAATRQLGSIRGVVLVSGWSHA